MATGDDVVACTAVVPAAGRGRRLGEDKALVDLRGRTAIERLVSALVAGGVHEIVVVREVGAAPLPALPCTRIVEIEVGDGAGMLESVRAGLATLPTPRPFLVLPVDHALVSPWTIERVVEELLRSERGWVPGEPGSGCPVVLPISFGRPGHPAGFVSALCDRLGEVETLRDIVRSHPAQGVAADDPWTRADLDVPEDLRRARAWLTESSAGVAAAMRRHRSCRSFTPDPLDDGLLTRLVDSARHASTSSFAQLYTIVMVRDEARRARMSELCGGQSHVADAPVFVAVCADLARIAMCCERHDREPQLDSFEAFLQAVVDAALVGQNLQLAAEAEGLGACMIGAARNHPVEIARALALPPRVFVLYGMVLGWPASVRVPHGRMPIEGVLHHEFYDPDANRRDRVFDGADEGMRTWASELNRLAGGYGGRAVDEHKGWSDRMAALWGSQRGVKGREDLQVRLRELGFLADRSDAAESASTEDG